MERCGIQHRRNTIIASDTLEFITIVESFLAYAHDSGRYGHARNMATMKSFGSNSINTFRNGHATVNEPTITES